MPCSARSDPAEFSPSNPRLALTPAGLAGWRADKYVPYGTEPRGKTYSIKYDLSRPELTDDQRRILAWPEQWEEYGLGEYGPGVPEEQSAKL